MKREDARSVGVEAQREKRATALSMRQQGYTYTQIGAAVGVHARTVQEWVARAQQEGVQVAVEGKPRGYATGTNRNLTAAQEAEIQRLITDRMPDQFKLAFALWTRQAVQELIAHRFGLEMPIRTVGEYLARWGFTPQRPCKRAYEQSPKAVQRWLDEEYPAIAERAKAEQAEIYWGDETGVKSRCQHGRSYAPQGQTPAVKLTSARFGVNMISALTNRGKLHFMLYRDRLNSERFIEFLDRLITECPKHKVFLILDNLKVHHSEPVKRWTAENMDRIEIFFLPSYSPELNPDEYLNGDLKQRLAKRPQARNKEQLQLKVELVMYELQDTPEHVASYFRHPRIKYAA